MLRIKKLVFPLILIVFPHIMWGSTFSSDVNFEDGYELWLRYKTISDNELLESYSSQLSSIVINANSSIMQSAKTELELGLSGLLNKKLSFRNTSSDRSIILGTPKNSTIIASQNLADLSNISGDGYILKSQKIESKTTTIIAANTDLGVLYGTFAFLRKLQTHTSIKNLDVISSPKMELRIVNHWDNFDRSVERGYAGLSLWDWSTLPFYKDKRYNDFARASASIGINAIAINNVNADAKFIKPEFLEKISVLAEIFKPYGIKVFLSINYASPITLGNLKTADPLNPEVKDWWRDKVDEIYGLIPDFGGFLVKADSEGQPGPKTYDRDHAVGANMLAEALEPYKGLVLWRAFVYSHAQYDRVREAYDEFVPLDGKFKDNVILQIKNGPLDFMPREPFSPLFGAMSKTNLMIEFQVTQEYLGNGNHLLFKAPMFKETLDADTFAKGNGSTVAKILEKKIYDYKHSGMTAVVNPGTIQNWTRHPFVQSSWYAFGRLAWNPDLSVDLIADEWIRMTFSNDQKVVTTLKNIMVKSAIAAVDYREPLGLTHIGTGSHYGPAPWSARSERFHLAAKDGIGFNRSSSGSNAVAQYNEPLSKEFEKLESTPEKYLLWFHHLPWDYEMKSGETLWNSLVSKYYSGVNMVKLMQQEFISLKGKIDEERFDHVMALLNIQLRDAKRWRDSCVLYFQKFSEMPIPEEFDKPEKDLEFYKQLEKTIYVE